MKILIVGFGNIGRGVYQRLGEFPDIELAAIVTRNPARVEAEVSNVPTLDLNNECERWPHRYFDVDVALLCGGSKDDLREQGPLMADYFNTVDSFDTHGQIDNFVDSGRNQTGYFPLMSSVAKQSGHLAAVCQGWDPGLFSMMRALFSACMPGSKAYAFYGLSECGGLSMGHSNACLQVSGVSGARSYTHARLKAIELVRSGAMPDFNPGDKHWRECFVSLHPGASESRVRSEIENMPEYFLDYETVVYFVSPEELATNHKSQAHDGLVIMASPTGVMEYRNQWVSNPLATAGIMLAVARATVELNAGGRTGAITPLDIPVSMLFPTPNNLLSFV